MSLKSINDIFELNIIPGYFINKSDESIIISKENGNGAINISYYKIPSSYFFNLERELLDFTNSIAENINMNILSKSERLIIAEIISNERYWKIWLFYQGGIAVFVTYNCNNKLKNDEIDDINKIVNSLQFK